MSRQLAEIFRQAASSRAGLSAEGQKLTLLDLLRLHGEDSAAVLLLLLAMLSVVPVAGLGSVLGWVILALAWRWHRGGEGGLLPERLRRVALGASWTRRCLHFLAWMYGTADRCLKARWPLLRHDRTHVLWGAWIGLMGALILLPLPLGNVLPGLSLMLLSLGWMFRDGLALLLSTVVGGGAIGFAFAMSHVLLEGGQMVLDGLDRLL